MGNDFSPYALFVVLQRDKGFGNRHGPKYLAGLHRLRCRKVAMVTVLALKERSRTPIPPCLSMPA